MIGAMGMNDDGEALGRTINSAATVYLNSSVSADSAQNAIDGYLTLMDRYGASGNGNLSGLRPFMGNVVSTYIQDFAIPELGNSNEYTGTSDRMFHIEIRPDQFDELPELFADFARDTQSIEDGRPSDWPPPAFHNVETSAQVAFTVDVANAYETGNADAYKDAIGRYTGLQTYISGGMNMADVSSAELRDAVQGFVVDGVTGLATFGIGKVIPMGGLAEFALGEMIGSGAGVFTPNHAYDAALSNAGIQDTTENYINTTIEKMEDSALKQAIESGGPIPTLNADVLFTQVVDDAQHAAWERFDQDAGKNIMPDK